MRFVIAGGSGSLGQRVAAHLENQGHDVVVLTRDPSRVTHGTPVQWDAQTVGDWQQHLQGAAIINLAGQLVDLRPTDANIALLRNSRVNATLALKNAMTRNGWTAPLWLQMSTLAIYGDAGDAVLDETAKPVKPLPQMTGVAQPWEEAFVGAPTKRAVVLRTGIVLDNNSPAMQKLVSVTKFGLGGRIASGKQWISWIHIDDFIAAIQHMIDTTTIKGVVHITSPNPVRNADLMKALRRTLHRPPAPPTPSLALKIGARIMSSDPMLALTGRRCVPAKLLETGFRFRHPDIEPALANLLSQRELDQVATSSFTYSEVGATKAKMPKGYVHHKFAVEIGKGRQVFEHCARELDAWNLQRASGFGVALGDNDSAVLAIKVFGLHFSAPCRVVYRVDETNRHGFAYGTLKGHPESGEEYFGLTIDNDGIVRFILRAFSRPAMLLAKLGLPVTRRLQLNAQFRYIEEMRTFAAAAPQFETPSDAFETGSS